MVKLVIAESNSNGDDLYFAQYCPKSDDENGKMKVSRKCMYIIKGNMLLRMKVYVNGL